MRLFCENKKHFQWVSWGTQTVVTYDARGANEVIDLADDAEEAKEAGEAKDVEEAKEAKEAKDVKDAEEVWEAKDVEDAEDAEDAVDADVAEGDDEIEWEESHAEVVVEVVGVGLEISCPHDPDIITGKPRGTACMVYGRQRVQRVSDRTAVGEMSYPTTLGWPFCLNGQPWEMVVNWTNYTGTNHEMSVVPYGNVEFKRNCGEGKEERVRLCSWKMNKSRCLVAKR